MTVTLIERFACARCGDTPPVTAAPRWLRAPGQPIPGSRVAVCSRCYREASSGLRHPSERGGMRAQPVQPAPRHEATGGGGAPALRLEPAGPA
jgi:hypothetical protein